METARCKAFLTAVETGSFTHAAEALHYTPSGVNQLVTALEQELGLTLLHRSQRGVQTTPVGKAMLPFVREFLYHENRMLQAAGEFNHLLVGSLTICTYSSVATHWLPTVIQEFCSKHPQITIQLMEGSREQTEQWLANNTADLAFYTYKKGMTHDWFPLADVPMLALLPRSHPLSDATVFPLKRFAEEPMILYSHGKDEDVHEVLRQNHLSPNITFSTLECYTTLAMVEHGLGISLMNALITQNTSYDIVQLPLDPPQHISIGIAVPSYANASPAARAFIQCALRTLSSENIHPNI